MLSYVLFWLVAATFVVGQAILIRSAWLIWRREASLPAGVPRSHGGADLTWTLLTAALTFVMLYYAYTMLVA